MIKIVIIAQYAQVVGVVFIVNMVFSKYPGKAAGLFPARQFIAIAGYLLCRCPV